MKRSLVITSLVLALTFGFVNLDFNLPDADSGSSVISLDLGTDVAQARPGGSRGGSFRPSRSSRPSTTRISKPKPKPRPATPRKDVRKPAPKRTDSATRAAQRQQSRARAAGAASRPTIKSSSGKPIRVAGTSAAKSVRSMSASKYNTRNARKDTYYRSIPPAQRTVVINRYGGGYYGDPFSGLFMYMLLSQSLHQQAMFHHNHWDSYSAQRQQALLAENAQLKAELATLESTPRDPNYAPPGADPDLMYSDEFVEAAYNPAEEDSGSNGTLFLVLALVVVSCTAGYFIFVRRTVS